MRPRTVRKEPVFLNHLLCSNLHTSFPSLQVRASHQFSSPRPSLLASDHPTNRILTPIQIPPTFHDYLRLASANNTLLLLLFTTSSCTPCRTITPLLSELILTRPPQPLDKFSSLAFAELELDSPDTSNGRMSDLGVEWGISSIPTLAGFGGRRAERITERLTDTRIMSDRARMGGWIDEQMAKGDGSPGGEAGGGLGGMLKNLFG